MVGAKRCSHIACCGVWVPVAAVSRRQMPLRLGGLTRRLVVLARRRLGRCMSATRSSCVPQFVARRKRIVDDRGLRVAMGCDFFSDFEAFKSTRRGIAILEMGISVSRSHCGFFRDSSVLVGECSLEPMYQIGRHPEMHATCSGYVS